MNNNFKKDLEYSVLGREEPFWQDAYKQAFPGMIFAQLAEDNCQGQQFGIDRVIQLSSGKTLYIDEKKRRRGDCGDILLEYKSNGNGSRNNGWMNKQLLIDYIAYAFMPDKRVYLLDWESLKRAWVRMGKTWFNLAKSKQEGFNIISAKNETYTTFSVAVPTKVLFEEMLKPIIVNIK